MRRRALICGVIGVFALIGLARPAGAQDKQVTFAGGFQYLQFIGYYEDKLPNGWGVSLSRGEGVARFVVDGGGHYGEGYDGRTRSIYTVQGGVEFAGSHERVVPFGRLMF